LKKRLNRSISHIFEVVSNVLKHSSTHALRLDKTTVKGTISELHTDAIDWLLAIDLG
jgi:hypothetical protein